jgi:hypothetical protein
MVAQEHFTASTDADRLARIIGDPQQCAEFMEAFLLSYAIDRQTDYVRRGRAFRDLDDATLSARWIEAFRDCVADPRDQEKRDRKTDLDAELALRGREPEWSQVRPELDAYAHFAKRMIEEMRETEPERYREFAEELGEEFAEFVLKRADEMS